MNNNSKAPKRQNVNEIDALDDALAHKIFEVIKNNPDIKQNDMVELLGIPRRTLQRKMIELQNAGKMKRVGGKRFGRWEIVNN